MGQRLELAHPLPVAAPGAIDQSFELHDLSGHALHVPARDLNHLGAQFVGASGHYNPSQIANTCSASSMGSKGLAITAAAPSARNRATSCGMALAVMNIT